MGSFLGQDWNGDRKTDFGDSLIDLELMEGGSGGDHGNGGNNGPGCGCAFYFLLLIGIIIALFSGC